MSHHGIQFVDHLCPVTIIFQAFFEKLRLAFGPERRILQGDFAGQRRVAGDECFYAFLVRCQPQLIKKLAQVVFACVHAEILPINDCLNEISHICRYGLLKCSVNPEDIQ